MWRLPSVDGGVVEPEGRSGTGVAEGDEAELLWLECSVVIATTVTEGCDTI